MSPVPAPEAGAEPRFTAGELENSFPLDKGRRFSHDGGKRIVHLVLAGMDGREQRQRARRASAKQRREHSVEALLANIVAAHLNRVDPERFVAVSFKRSDYIRSPLCREALASCRDYLHQEGLIDWAEGFRKVEVHGDKPLGRLTRVRATGRLREIVGEAGLGSRSLTIPTDYLIRINKPVAGLPAIPDDVAASRKVIEAVNRRLAATAIEVGAEAIALLKAKLIEDEGEDREARDRKRRYAGDLTARSIYRAFKGDWQSGGRFYGGWWMSFPKGLRHHITIDGEPVVELDYKTLHPLLLYARAGLEMSFDPYLPHPWQSGSMRELGKRTFNRLLNRNERDPAKRLKIRAAPGDRAILGRTRFTTYVQHLVGQLHGVQQWFGTGAGMQLQREDSELALSVMTTLESAGVPVLPIHDSFIVAARHEHFLHQTMTDAFFERYRRVPRIDRKPPPSAAFSDMPRVHN